MHRENLARSLRESLLGPEYTRFKRNLTLLSAVVLAVATCLAYAVDLFTVSGGILIIPGDATTVGLVVAVGIGYRSRGLLFAWIPFFATYLGFHADWAFFGLSGRGLSGRLAFFFDPVSLAVFGTAAVFLGTLAYGVGSLAHRCVGRIRQSNPFGDS
jgi:hypothetical protein